MSRVGTPFVMVAILAGLIATACNSANRGESESQGDAARGALSNDKAGVMIPFGQPLVVRGDVKVAPGESLRPPLGVDARRGVIVIVSLKNATLDLTGVSLRGTPPGTELDKNVGYGIVLEECENITIRGGKIGGYKDCIVARGCKGLVIDGVQFDGWYGMRLRSTAAAEDASDWLYPHENDKDEWMQNYGAAIALTDCIGATVKGCRGRHGQNGILLTRCSACRVFDDDFSFLSGWGLALYRSSKNVVSHNQFDYCVRGYSHGVYWRGQDSAGILMFERCSDNLFAKNSATHGGDGLFLFAGNDLLLGRALDKHEVVGGEHPLDNGEHPPDSGEHPLDAGGSDRNIWYQNDFSYAVANAIEATFSEDNWAIENRLDGSHQHGVWGGYSRRMVILKNQIEDTVGGAISIEHGQECAIAMNTIERNDIGIELWWDEDKELVQGPFGQHRDTASRDHWISANTFAGNVQDIVLKQTTGVAFANNRYPSQNRELHVDKLESAAGPSTNSSVESASRSTEVKDWLAGEGDTRPSGLVSNSSLRQAADEPEILKRALAWKCPDVPGALEISASAHAEKSGLDTIVIGEWGPWDWRSGEPKPKPRVAGGELANVHWDARWFSWRDGADPRKDAVLWRELAHQPLVQKTVPNFVNPWAGDADVKAKVGSDHFGLVATTTITLPEGGKFRVSVLSDDGVRVSIDKKLVLENWTWHAPTRDQQEIELAPGEHSLAVEYFQIDGASALSIELDRIMKP